MSEITKQNIEQALSSVKDIYLDDDLITLKSINDIKIEADNVSIELELNYPAKSYHQTLKDNITTALTNIGVKKVTINITTKILAHSVQKGLQGLPDVKNVIAIASGKGGVGKSTTSVNIALALQAEGAKVAILDADIYGPSIPKMLGIQKQKPESTAEGKLLPILGHKMQSMSVGFLVPEDSPMIWRGPMVTQALEQLLRDTLWRNVDYMIIDLPPGTGDTQLTLSQKIPVSGSVIVTTPQDIALLDAKKGLKMFEKVSIPILGIVENMSLHICSKCGHEEEIFGVNGGKNMAEENNTTFLGALPLEMGIREAMDLGNPTLAQDENSKTSMLYKEIAKKLTAKLAKQPKEIASFPSITIE
ncbi:Scaffold protein for [4Fe-4S] cluster assembly ApbC, MRP-like [hydrothermal vent metagenome]|uniref:Scaffold protein for [4Fe-4S] cluster assembly ApbC, MRP-like n=1 Tax=hydrothermal vent metagenome TaxID=652676 RepID=A0A1W1BEE9_9ZZZZ